MGEVGAFAFLSTPYYQFNRNRRKKRDYKWQKWISAASRVTLEATGRRSFGGAKANAAPKNWSCPHCCWALIVPVDRPSGARRYDRPAKQRREQQESVQAAQQQRKTPSSEKPLPKPSLRDVGAIAPTTPRTQKRPAPAGRRLVTRSDSGKGRELRPPRRPWPQRRDAEIGIFKMMDRDLFRGKSARTRQALGMRYMRFTMEASQEKLRAKFYIELTFEGRHQHMQASVLVEGCITDLRLYM
ncbi:hypothetical protein HPB50_025801 [Hyalomma asiaticum]|uniref:Uncharacterized protein n=1 Tax=Hyalomma asiaticum TaxID=266040 RepID=A0ACB7SR93_HYAAI|nr:hypothetical protein HPB50_025801 [Hyalomma asiaticum]